jgi:hypothetical protein
MKFFRRGLYIWNEWRGALEKTTETNRATKYLPVSEKISHKKSPFICCCSSSNATHTHTHTLSHLHLMFYQYIPPHGLAALQHYKYTGTDLSILANTILKYYWNWVTEHIFPLWVAYVFCFYFNTHSSFSCICF